MTVETTQSRRAELLAIAAGLFAEKGFKNTTVRDIADASGILSGSLYHHFDSKESMVDEILSTFQEELFAAYDAVLAWMTLLTEGVESGALRADLDVELTYRFIRDTVWVAVRWYRPGGKLTHRDIADQYLRILLDGIAHA